MHGIGELNVGSLIPAVLVSLVTVALPTYSKRCSHCIPELLSSLSSVLSLSLLPPNLSKFSPMEAKDYTQDGTVDLHGHPVLASKTGKWKACAFLVGIIFSLINFLVLVFLFHFISGLTSKFLNSQSQVHSYFIQFPLTILDKQIQRY